MKRFELVGLLESEMMKKCCVDEVEKIIVDNLLEEIKDDENMKNGVLMVNRVSNDIMLEVDYVNNNYGCSWICWVSIILSRFGLYIGDGVNSEGKKYFCF